MTRKLYYEDLYAKEFNAQVISQTEREGNYHVILDQTLFYPSGGGQPCDLGNIEGINLIDVHENGEEIIHVLEAPVETQTVHGMLDWNRRFELMQQHLGEHIFAGCLYNMHQIHTARMRIEGDNVSIDTDIPVDINTILEAEAAANEAVWQNIPVDVIYPDMSEIRTFARKLPPENAEAPIRIVRIEGVDYVPCCGLHVDSTGQVGLIKATSCENHKGGSRIYLKCGRAAYRWLDDVYRELRKAEAELVCGYDGINSKIQTLKSQIHDLKAHNEATIEHYLRPIAEGLIREAEVSGTHRIVRHVMDDSGQEEVKRMFRLLTDGNHDVVAFLAGVNADGVFLTFGTNRENKGIDVRQAFRKAISALDGKGGGSAFCAQGWGKKSDDIEAVIDGSML